MMGSGSGFPGGGAMGLEQFVSYDPDDMESTQAAVRHMEDAVADAVSHGFPPGKEAMYLELRDTDETVWAKLAASNQPAVYRFQRKIKDFLDPNDVGDRLYATLPPDRP